MLLVTKYNGNDKALRVNELDIQNVKLQIADLDSGSMNWN